MGSEKTNHYLVHWTLDEETQLAEIVLSFVRQGGTQQSAFAEAARLLGRGASACAFKWNSTVKMRCEKELLKAKALRKNKRDRPTASRRPRQTMDGSKEGVSKRRNAWTPDNDEDLAEIVLKHIGTGGTQLAAFAEAAHVLGRTPMACGFRWNGVLRKKYDQAFGDGKPAVKDAQETPLLINELEGPTDTSEASAVRQDSMNVGLKLSDTQFLVHALQNVLTALDEYSEIANRLSEENEELKQMVQNQRDIIEDQQMEIDRMQGLVTGSQASSETASLLEKVIEKAETLLQQSKSFKEVRPEPSDDKDETPIPASL